MILLLYHCVDITIVQVCETYLNMRRPFSLGHDIWWRSNKFTLTNDIMCFVWTYGHCSLWRYSRLNMPIMSTWRQFPKLITITQFWRHRQRINTTSHNKARRWQLSKQHFNLDVLICKLYFLFGTLLFSLCTLTMSF